MTFNKLFFFAFKKFPNLNKFDFYQLIFYFSKKITNKNSIALNLQQEIDFDFNNFMNILKLHYKNFKPISRIIGYEEFDDIKILLDDNVFAPRIETVAWCKRFIEENKEKTFKSYLDICCGTGLISIFFKKKLKIKNAIGIDSSFKAIEVAKKNAYLNKVKIKFVKEKIEDFMTKKKQFELITCNPPYISEFDLFVDNSALLYDPYHALFSQNNGLYFYQLIISKLDYLLSKQGKIIFEIGFNQKKSIEKILWNNSVKNFYFVKDFNNLWRTLIIIRE